MKFSFSELERGISNVDGTEMALLVPRAFELEPVLKLVASKRATRSRASAVTPNGFLKPSHSGRKMNVIVHIYCS